MLVWDTVTRLHSDIVVRTSESHSLHAASVHSAVNEYLAMILVDMRTNAVIAARLNASPVSKACIRVNKSVRGEV